MLKSDLDSRHILRFLWLSLMVALLSAGCGLTGDFDAPVNEDPPTDLPTGTIVIQVETVPANEEGIFSFTGVPQGTISTNSTLVVSDLQPGTYTTTQVRPGRGGGSNPTDDQQNEDEMENQSFPSSPDFDVSGVTCDDDGSPTTSSGDAVTRTAVINVDPGETVTCVFTNTKRGTLVVTTKTNPEGEVGEFQFTGVPQGTIPANGTLVVSLLQPGTYTTTQVDPEPIFDISRVACDDETSPIPSASDPATRSVVFNLDPGEKVTCTFTNTKRGSAVIEVETEPPNTEGEFIFTGIPQGPVDANEELEIPNLPPGTYTSTQMDPEPDFNITEVRCDDEGSATVSSGDSVTRSAIFNIDPGERVTCTFVNAARELPPGSMGSGIGGNSENPGEESEPGEGINPFDDPDTYLADFPLPESLPPEAGNELLPLSGPWQVTHFSGQMDCGVMSMNMAEIPPEPGTLTVSEDGQEIVGAGLLDSQGVPVIMNAASEIKGRFTGVFDGAHEGIPVEINYYWQVITQEYIVGYLTSSFTQQGTTCKVYRPFELVYDG